jgi:16S rRNA (cytosine1402-N4)-methyltransferase
MVQEIIKFLEPRPCRTYLDATVGTGGHTHAILDQSAPTGRVIGIDTDGESLNVARQRLAPFGERVILVHARYEEAGSILKGLGISGVDGVVLDLGMSSYQLETPGRGFSFQVDDPLDMRMDRTQAHSAFEFLRALPERDLADVLRNYGEERWASRIARAIARALSGNAAPTTRELAHIVRSAIPPERRRQRIHPATRTFQAVRIAVNRETEGLQNFLTVLPDLIHKGGRLCVLSFHSLEDRIVKQRFVAWERGCAYGLGSTSYGPRGIPVGHVLERKVIRPSRDEVFRNPRARSARLRVIERT